MYLSKGQYTANTQQTAVSSNVVAFVGFWLSVRSGFCYYPLIWDPVYCNQAVLTGAQKCLSAKLPDTGTDDQAKCIAGIQVWQVNVLWSIFVWFKNSFLPSEEPQTVCPHGLVTELGCHIHSVHARQGFLCLREKRTCILPGLLNSISKRLPMEEKW